MSDLKKLEKLMSDLNKTWRNWCPSSQNMEKLIISKETGKTGEKAAKICGNSGPTHVARGWLRG